MEQNIVQNKLDECTARQITLKIIYIMTKIVVSHEMCMTKFVMSSEICTMTKFVISSQMYIMTKFVVSPEMSA